MSLYCLLFIWSQNYTLSPLVFRWWRTSPGWNVYGVSFSKWSISMPDKCGSKPLSDNDYPFLLLCILVKYNAALFLWRYCSFYGTHYYKIKIGYHGAPQQIRIPGLWWWGESYVASRCKNYLRVFESTGWQWRAHFTRTLVFKSSKWCIFSISFMGCGFFEIYLYLY